MNLPDDVVKQELFHYLSVYDIMRLDSASMNHEYRPKLLEKINGVILSGDSDISMGASLFKWLGLIKICLINMYFHLDSPSSIENDYADQFIYSIFSKCCHDWMHYRSSSDVYHISLSMFTIDSYL